jgi:hypothetical protein
MGHDPRNLIYAMLQFDSVIQSLLFFLLEPSSPGRVKPKTLKLVLVASPTILYIYFSGSDL